MYSSKDDLKSILSECTFNNIIDRIHFFSEEFLGTPYMPLPLGEGEHAEFNQSPLYRFDGFDCTTFVETVCALAMSISEKEFEFNINNLRYKNGDVTFETRNHFPSLDWVPNNIQFGFFEEITFKIVDSDQLQFASTLIDRVGWYSKLSEKHIYLPQLLEEERTEKLNQLKRRAPDERPQYAEIPYIPISLILEDNKILERIPNGSILNIIRLDWDITEKIGTRMNVSHQGFVLKFRDKIVLRHASTTYGNQVTDVPLFDYLNEYKDHDTIKGIHLLKVQRLF